MTIVETVLVFALIPLAIYGVITLLTLWPKATRTPRYRPGQEWGFEPVWWSANPAGVGSTGASGPYAQQVEDDATGEPARTARGGARGSW
ncbi:hypothetical protein F0L68_05250 [Solihabitans fulvus]|uniref:Uncharacterized protein n=1 Tax=Solihabitans fulvus TaxID=1892852 RepID=A0A5B2XN01_9PSEU|nr:hypothetical protein [Solihabitans fulvus]KAA2265248.1 hypothetical protein F0L68_05250 [Solihabitans fulvus]